MSDELLSKLKPWTKNPRKNADAVEPVMESIRRFGFGAPIVAREADGMIIAGHTRYEAAKRLGLESVPVRWMGLSRADAEALALADNKLGEIAEWNDVEVTAALRDLRARSVDLDGLGFDAAELDRLCQDMPEIDPDDLSDATHVNGESEYQILRMMVRKDENAEVLAALAAWPNSTIKGRAERLGALFLSLVRGQ